MKKLLIIATALVALGAVVSVFAASRMNFDFKKLDNSNYVTNTYDFSESFKNISVDTDITRLTFKPATNGKTTVECFEEEKLRHEVSVSNGTLTIKSVNERKISDFSMFSMRSPEVTVYLPEKIYKNLKIDTDTGNIDIPSDFSFSEIDITGDTADVRCYASASGDVKINLSTGMITLDGVSANNMELVTSTGMKSLKDVNVKNDLYIHNSTGSASVTDSTCANLTSDGSTGDMDLKNVIVTNTMKIERSTGDVRIERCDAAEVYVTTDTGSVKGSFLSDKVFFASSDTGSINVPKTTNGGKCEITTDTGDIKFEIVK